LKPTTRGKIEKFLKDMAEVARNQIEISWKVKGDIIVQLEPKNDKEKIEVTAIYE